MAPIPALAQKVYPAFARALAILPAAIAQLQVATTSVQSLAAVSRSRGAQQEYQRKPTEGV